MKIKKSQLEVLFNLAKGTEGALNLAESRIRDSFIKPLSDITQKFYDQREVVYKHFAKKNEEGQPDLLNGNQYQFDKSILDELNEELSTLLNEEVDVDFTDNPQAVKQILEKSDYKPKLLEAEQIDELLNQI